MSRQSQITEALTKLREMKAIQAFHKGNNKAEPNKLEWFVQVNELDLLYLNSREVESFINGAKAVLVVASQPAVA